MNTGVPTKAVISRSRCMDSTLPFDSALSSCCGSFTFAVPKSAICVKSDESSYYTQLRIYTTTWSPFTLIVLL
jgi:hypothetical protein